MEIDNQANPVVTEQPTGQPAEPVQQSATGQQSGPTQQPDRTFTRDEVTTILKRRIDRYQNSVFNKYGVKNAAELDSLFEKAKGYDDNQRTIADLTEKVAFLGNNIDENRYDDIRTYFKGKGLQFTEDALKQQLESHPEWLKKTHASNKTVTTITPVGTGQQTPTGKSDKDIAEKMFGMEL